MKKLVRTNLTNSPTRRGTENLNIQFYSHDRNNAGFEFVVSNESDLTNYTAKVLFNFTDSASTWEVNGIIEGNVVKISFNTDLIARCEEVLGFLFLDSDSDSLDVFKFKFNVVLSEIDKNEVEKRRIKHVENISSFELVTRAELKEELSKLQTNGVDLTNYLTTKIANETYALKNEIPSINGFVTTGDLTEAKKSVVEEIKNLGYAKTTEVPAAYNDSALSERVTNLENKVDKDTIYDDSDLKSRVQTLENRSTTITSYDDKSLSDRVRALENAPKVNTTEFNSFKEATSNVVNSVKNRLSRVEKSLLEQQPNQTLSLNNGTLSISGGNSVTLPASQYEIHGTGMPNGVVEAEIGTTYIDKNKTNGAFKWIKTTDGGNQGWEVLTGDTGWRALNILSKLGSSFVKVRRVNNEVTYQFGGLSWGWFGIVRRGGVGYVTQTTDTERNCFIVGEHGIPAGFRTPNSLIGSIYNDRGIVYGTWYVGNGGDANHLRFQFLNPIPTDSDIGDIRVSQISYLTDEPWPQQLP